MGELLDSGTLDGMLDTDATSAVQPGRPDQRNPRYHSALLRLQHPTYICNAAYLALYYMHLPLLVLLCLTATLRLWCV